MSREKTLNYGLDKYKEELAPKPNEGLVIVTQEKHITAFQQALALSGLSGTLVLQRGEHFEATSQPGALPNLLLLAQNPEINGTVNAAANAINMQSWYTADSGIQFDKSSILLAGGKSTRNLGLAPQGNKGLIVMPNDRSLIDLGIRKIKQFSDGINNGTLIMACDEVVVLEKRPDIDPKRFNVIGGELSIDDPYLTSCGTCEVVSGDLKNFYEKRGKDELRGLFPNQPYIPVSWGGYFIPREFEDAFSHLFNNREYGEFSRMIESGYVDDQDRWLKSNPDYQSGFVKSSSEWLKMNGGFSFANAGKNAFFEHIGTNKEYYTFCQRLFRDEVIQEVLGTRPTRDRQIISASSYVSEDAEVGEEVIIHNNSRVEKGKIGNKSVISNAIIQGSVGEQSLVVNTSGEIDLAPSTFHATVAGGKRIPRTVTFSMDTDIKKEKDLLEIALGL